MKNSDKNHDEICPEYDFSSLKGGVRGKYFERASAGSNLVLLDPDVAKAFPSQDAVNRALRMLAEIAAQSTPNH